MLHRVSTLECARDIVGVGRSTGENHTRNGRPICTATEAAQPLAAWKFEFWTLKAFGLESGQGTVESIKLLGANTGSSFTVPRLSFRLYRNGADLVAGKCNTVVCNAVSRTTGETVENSKGNNDQQSCPIMIGGHMLSSKEP
jgi:hypothetical protein